MGRIITVLSYLIVIILPFILFSSSGRDDCHITFWSAYSLSHYGAIYNYNGELLEQSSSFFQVIIMALLHFITRINMVLLGYIISIAGGLATLFFASRLYNNISTAENRSFHFVALLIATQAYFLYWVIGGLETSLVAMSLVLLLYSFTEFINGKKLWLVIVSNFIFLTVRPETPIVMALGLVGFAILYYLNKATSKKKLSQDTQKQILKFAGISIAVIIVLFLFRYIYFGQWFPQPVSVKSEGLSSGKLQEGFLYFFSNIQQMAQFVFTSMLLFLVFYILNSIINKIYVSVKYLFPFSILLTYIAFVFTSGGDWMEAGRFIVPLIPLTIVLATGILEKHYKPNIVLLVILLIPNIIGMVFTVRTQSTGYPAAQLRDLNNRVLSTTAPYSYFEINNKVHRRDIPVVNTMEEVLRAINPTEENKVVIASGQGGMVLYHIATEFFRKFEFIDLRGLTSTHISDCPLSEQLQKEKNGLVFVFGTFFNDIIPRCNLPKPHIIFDLSWGQEIALMQNNGYQIIHVQLGKISSKNKFYRGGTVHVNQFIAVREDIFPLVNKKVKRVEFTWAE